MMFNHIPMDTLKGIGPNKKKLYSHMGINTLGDLLAYYPINYQDRRNPVHICDVFNEQTVLIKGRVILIAGDKVYRGRKQVLRFLVDDNTGKMEVVFFNASYLKNVVKNGSQYYFYGKVTSNNGRLQMIHPEVISADKFVSEIVPIYHTIKGISQNEIRKRIKEALKMEIEDFLPEEIIGRHNMCPLDFKLKNMHFPSDKEHLKVAKYRQIYEELFVMQLGLEMMHTGKKKGVIIDSNCDEFKESLGFKLTEAQEKVIEDILKDMSSGVAMNRLLQGDVGSGKTAVAAVALYNGAKAGFQGAFMAPTEILAKQHFKSLKGIFARFNIKVGLITGSMKASEKKAAQEKIKSGDYQIVVGTHALIQEGVKFNNLGIVITDEQHRFGVNQRVKLGDKGINPHVLVMTATPIPRTLAVILYGDLDMSIIDKLPAGRKEIKTVEIKEQKRMKVYDIIRNEIKEGSQAYVVAPLIEESENLPEIKSVETLEKELKAYYKPYDINIAVVHGSMKQEEKDNIMYQFGKGKIDILIATVVIEVGINVPNATVMVIEDAERFGLAQLHQLRGRVGRGEKQSYCYLVNRSKSDVAQKRMDIMCKSSDGFFISEKDLELRGPGEVFGTRQHGIPDVSLINAVKHIDILEKAKKDAKEYADKIDEKLKEKVLDMYGENITINL